MAEATAISIDETADRLSISRSGVYRLIKARHLRTKKIFQRQVVLCESLDEFLNDPAAVSQ